MNPIPYTVTDLPIPYRVRVAAPSAELRAFVVPKLGVRPTALISDVQAVGEVPSPPESETRLRVA